MANEQQSLPSQNIFQRFFFGAQALLNQLREGGTWQALWNWVLWRVMPKHRRIFKLTRELQPLDPSTPTEMRTVRDEVFARSCLELQRIEEAQILLDILKHVHQPLGFEQIFFAAIYPVLVKRDMEAVPILTKDRHRLDVEIGYLGHNEDYFFWMFEIDGTKNLSLDSPLVPRLEMRDDKRYVVYSLGSAGLVDADYAEYAGQWLLDSPRLTMALRLLSVAYAEQWILNARVYFSHILADLKKRNYQVTAMAIPDFERARLSLVRRLSLDRLRKRQFLSERRNR